MMTTQRTFEPHVFEAYAEAGNICRHCDRGKYALHHQQTEFDKVFDQMEAPEYPATCDNCGEVGTNASMEQHDCSEHHDTPAAPERGDDGVNRYLKSEIEHLLKENSTLIAQRERLIHALKRMLDSFSPFSSENTEQYREEVEAYEEAQAVIATSEQEGRRKR